MNFAERHSFGINKAFLKKSVSDDKEYLQVALDIEKSIRRHAVESETEVYWKENVIGKPGPVNVSLGYGQAGILYFYLQLFEATQDESFVPLIEKSVNYIRNHWKEGLPPEPHRYTWPDAMAYGIYRGISGTGDVLLLVYRRFKFETAELVLNEIYEYLKAKAVAVDGGVKWTGSPVSLADGGVLMFLTAFYEIKPSEDLKNFLSLAGKAYLTLGIPHENGGLEFSDFETAKLAEPDFPHKVSQPNFELGSAGAGFVLARLYQTLKDDAYLDAAKKVEVYLDSIKINQAKGFLLPYRVGDPNATVYYLGNCHGAAGTAKFYYILGKISGDKTYFEKLHQLFDGFESFGAPDRMSGGFWNNSSVCCGNAGVLNTTIGLYENLGEKRWADLAQKSAEILLGERDLVENGIYGWPIAYRRIAPTEFSHTIFYNDGDAGIAASLLRAYFKSQNIKNPNSLAEDPFGA